MKIKGLYIVGKVLFKDLSKKLNFNIKWLMITTIYINKPRIVLHWHQFHKEWEQTE